MCVCVCVCVCERVKIINFEMLSLRLAVVVSCRTVSIQEAILKVRKNELTFLVFLLSLYLELIGTLSAVTM